MHWCLTAGDSGGKCDNCADVWILHGYLRRRVGVAVNYIVLLVMPRLENVYIVHITACNIITVVKSQLQAKSDTSNAGQPAKQPATGD